MMVMAVVNLKQKIRRQEVYHLWLQKKSEQQIANQLGISLSTVKRDLEMISSDMETSLVDWAPIRREALMSLRADKSIVYAALQDAEPGSHAQAKFLKLLLDADALLDRMGQPPKAAQKHDITIIRQEAIIVQQFITEHHPELLPDFSKYLNLKRKERKEAEKS